MHSAELTRRQAPWISIVGEPAKGPGVSSTASIASSLAGGEAVTLILVRHALAGLPEARSWIMQRLRPSLWHASGPTTGMTSLYFVPVVGLIEIVRSPIKR